MGGFGGGGFPDFLKRYGGSASTPRRGMVRNRSVGGNFRRGGKRPTRPTQARY